MQKFRATDAVGIATDKTAGLPVCTMPWYYEVDRQQRGPVSEDEFAGLVQAGTVRAETLVWKDGWPDWRPYAAVAAGAVPAAGIAPDGAGDTAVCAVSGKTMLKRDMLEFEGRWVGAEHKAEFFQRLREGVALPQEVVYATVGRRWLAKIVDGLLVGVVNAIVGAVLGVVFAGSIAGGGPEAAGGMALLMQVVIQLSGIVLALAYTVYFVRKDDATPGKKMLGLRLLRANGDKLSTGRIIGRYFAEWVSSITLGIGYLMAAFDKEQRRSLHDRMCDTRVIDVRGR